MDPKSKDSFDSNYLQTGRAPLPGEFLREENQPQQPETLRPVEQQAAQASRQEQETVRERQEQKISSTQPEGFLDETIEGLKRKLRKPKAQKPTQIPQVRDELTQQVETILEEGLKDAFKELTPLQREKFKIEGEKIAWEIRNLIRSTKVKVKGIFSLIVEWLKLLPGVNRFFLVQEAKIKTDKIIALAHQQQKMYTKH
ncbi:MAG: hypothetical protein A3J66_00750 [Candidatus Magasanikbacteria bacterium RIFCSPHIGHO2_02_FULL_47_14]|uniref:Uncharacterized protein n=1 Tax=Candidatus Magasanikbacteria bacterium RIFCSPHIGHO2_02_FULL_47_14 TaxID=1798680 RepID=A0A1F6LYZ1_9BACT|nr:MAG: hypothetical protein A3J66_00750 [Candidatus Magasanikbacteria bacterium RIFCSPHIGHO2_02_FULL_47_14]